MRLALLKLSLCLLAFSPVAASKESNIPVPNLAPKSPTVLAKAYLLIDGNSDKVLAEKNSEAVVEPASLTKMMTMYIVDNEMKSGNLKLTDEVVISKRAWQAPGSRMFLNVGDKVKVEDLVKGVIIQSGNDASVALAEHIAGSEEAFADLMNQYSHMLGMQNTHYMNASGLPDKTHYTTAQDMAILARAIVKNFPETYKLYSQKEFTYNGITQINRNQLLWRNNAVDGIKTGHSETAGYCLVASGVEDDMRLIAIVMGAKTERARTEETNKLLAWGFRFYETHLVLKGGDSLQSTPVWMGKQNALTVGLAEDLYVTTPRGVYKKYTVVANVLGFIKAPIRQGDVVGNYVVLDENNNTVVEHPIVALTNIPQGNIWQRGKDYVTLNVKSIFARFS